LCNTETIDEGHDEKEWMEDLEDKIILISKLQMKDKSLDNNCRSEELVFHNEMDYEVKNEKYVI